MSEQKRATLKQSEDDCLCWDAGEHEGTYCTVLALTTCMFPACFKGTLSAFLTFMEHSRQPGVTLQEKLHAGI